MGDGFDRIQVRDDPGRSNNDAGSGGYDSDRDSGNRQGEDQGERSAVPDRTRSRGEDCDEQSGGGRAADAASFDRDGLDEFGEDQREHQDRGQSEAEDEA